MANARELNGMRIICSTLILLPPTFKLFFQFIIKKLFLVGVFCSRFQLIQKSIIRAA